LKACVFVGPSCGAIEVPLGVDRFGPASLGSIFLAVNEGYERIGLVDGLFGNVPSVWHKEIIFAICNRIPVFGSSSMGALRAAELWGYRMQGVGRVYRYFRSGMLTDDDEVCVLHATQELGFEELSLPMVNIRRTLSILKKIKRIDTPEMNPLVHRIKETHFSSRTIDRILELAVELRGSRWAHKLCDGFVSNYDNVKQKDYQQLISVLLDDKSPDNTGMPEWSSIETRKWKPQFEDQIDDLPELRPW
jgi:hypothetical protein